MTDEELIEKAAKAIHDAHVPVEGTEVPPWDRESDAWRETYRDFARAALAVFREHTAPREACSGDEAEALDGMSEYAPTTDEVREAYILAADTTNADRDNGEDFDNWLNRVRAEALREARDNVRASSFWADGSDNYADRVRGYLSNAADRIEQNREEREGSET